MASEFRYEIKIVLGASHLSEMRSFVFSHSNAFGIAYPPRQVNNLYFDTFDHQCLIDHIDGVPNRAKIRYRWYGDTWKLNTGQLEIKKKIARLGHKTIFPFTGCIDLVRSNWREVHSALCLGLGLMDISQGILDLLEMLQPTLINRYKREYYLSMDGVVRLTLDYDIRSYEQGFSFRPNISYQKPSLNNLIVELKAPKNEYQRIADVLSEFPRRCSRYSKYLIGMDH